jgi:hypothetical protein
VDTKQEERLVRALERIANALDPTDEQLARWREDAAWERNVRTLQAIRERHGWTSRPKSGVSRD